MSLFRAEHIALSYRRGGEAVPLLRDASLSLEAGVICDLVGPSGAGKSTLLRACALMLGRDSGELDEVDAAVDDDSAPAVGRLTRSLVDARPACLRIRHRASDGFASGTFTLADGALSFAAAGGEGVRP